MCFETAPVGSLSFAAIAPESFMSPAEYVAMPGFLSSASRLKSPAISPAIKLPSEAARNHVPIICPTKRFGASLVTELNPTGLRQSSPIVCRR